MKNTIKIVLLLLFTVCTYAQQGINYKAVIKDGSGNILSSSPVSIQFIIYEGAALTNNVYQETHTTTTDANGIIIINIGEGTTANDYTLINWAGDEHFLNTQIDIGAGLIDMGTTGFKTVPYAMSLIGGIDQAYITILEAQIAALDARITDLHPPPFVGELREGGIVFWVDPADNMHGLVCAIEDQSLGIRWNNGTNVVTGGTGITIGTGSANTDLIITQQGPVETSYAAGLARAYVGGGFNDWFLPSKDELNEMFVNKATIDATATTNSGAMLSSNFYWSSSEIDINNAWGHLFAGGGSQSDGPKSSAILVRAVRAF